MNNLSLLKLGLMIFVFALDCASPPDLIFPVFYAVIILIGKPTSIYGIWGYVLLGVAFTMISPIISVPPGPGCLDRGFWINRLMVLLAILMSALATHQRAEYQK